MKLRVKWSKGVGVFLIIEVVNGNGRDTDIIESVNGINLKFELL